MSAVGAALVLCSSFARAGDVVIVPSATGHIGAWLAAGPLPGSAKASPAPRTLQSPLLRTDDSEASGRAGQRLAFLPSDEDGSVPRSSALVWRVVSANAGPLDLAQQLELGNARGDAFAYLFGVLHVEQAFKGFLLLGSSDGARVLVDGEVVWSTDGARPERDDEDAVALALSAGDHPVLIKLHHREGYWAVRARVVDASLRPPRGVTLRLPGTSDADAQLLGARMVEIAVDRGLQATGFAPVLAVNFPEGMPKGIDRTVHASAEARLSGNSRSLFRLNAGQVALTRSGPVATRFELPQLARDDLDMVERSEGGLVTIALEVAGRRLDASFEPNPAWHDALLAVSRASAQAGESADPQVMRATLEHLRDRLVSDVGQGLADAPAIAEQTATLMSYADDLARGRDPLRSHAGIRRLAYRSEIDGQLSPFGVHVPQSFAEGRAPPGKTYPLVVALHGMNGKPISMLHWTFGHDDEVHDSEWEDRRAGELSAFDGFVIAPNAFGNGMYREFGEVDVMRVLDWAVHFFPIDPDRVSITGVSMGGTGAASVALHYPDRFAAAMPLCGYHSYLVRRDLMGKRMRSWEQRLIEQRSNTSWAENGAFLPMFVWHGKRDLPEKNSGVLIDRYLELGYSMQHEHPDVGHDVWRRAYADGAGLAWLAAQKRVLRPRHIVFRTSSPRYLDDGWVHVRELAADLSFAQIDARLVDDARVEVTTDKVGAFTLDRSELGADGVPVVMTVDGATFTFAANVPVAVHRKDGAWTAGERAPVASSALSKRAGLSGPIRDVFYEPLVFVYGSQDPTMTSVNRETARFWAHVRYGVDAQYPVISDRELDDEIAASHALVLVGNAASNSVVQQLESGLPFRVTGDTITATTPKGRRQWRGRDLGVAFIYPNPRHPDRYVVVLEGTSALGTFRATALPDLLPDFLVYGPDIAAARGQIVLGGARTLAAGLFRADWALSALE